MGNFNRIYDYVMNENTISTGPNWSLVEFDKNPVVLFDTK